jgi:uncharacterized membrane-anchored protein
VKLFTVGSRWLAGLCIALASFPALAQPTDAAKAEFQAAAAAAQNATLAGPADIKLIDQAVLKLPRDLSYIPAAEAGRLLNAMGNRTGEGLLGMVLAPASGAEWFVVMRFNKSGYIKDDDAKEWNADDLLKNLREGTEAGNTERTKRGIPAIEVVGWVQSPTYDAATHRLVWSASTRAKDTPRGGDQGVNYNTYLLGREVTSA